MTFSFRDSFRKRKVRERPPESNNTGTYIPSTIDQFEQQFVSKEREVMQERKEKTLINIIVVWQKIPSGSVDIYHIGSVSKYEDARGVLNQRAMMKRVLIESAV